MNNDLPFQDWDLDLIQSRSLRFRLLPFLRKVSSSLLDSKPKVRIDSASGWVVLTAADEFKFVIKKDIYRRFLDVSQFLNNICHFSLGSSVPDQMSFHCVDPYVMSVCCKYLHWKYKYGDYMDRPGFITCPGLHYKVLKATKSLVESNKSPVIPAVIKKQTCSAC